MQYSDSEIMGFNPAMLLSEDFLYSIYDIEDAIERERLKALVITRATELKIKTAVSNIFKKMDETEKELARAEYQHNEIPLQRGKEQKPLNTIQNYLNVLHNDKMFDGLCFNQLTYSPEVQVDKGLRRWTDADDSQARRYIEEKYELYSVAKLDDALRIVFREREYHPIRQIIDSTQWDGIERIPTLLIKWLGCEDTPYSREVSRLIFAGGINRLYNPGCKFDDVPILIGTRQGEGKSTFVRWLALSDEFFTEVNEIEGQKGMEAIEGAWICEIAELLALTKTKEQEAVKSYITRQNDRYRRPFDKRVTDHKRQCVFIGTTNKAQFLTDKTGNRRFYPITVNQSGYDLFDNEAEIKADIMQCWAEAKAKLDKGEMKPYADRSLKEEIREHQQNAVEDDWREGMIAHYLDGRDEVCILELWQCALNNPMSKPTKKDSNEIALILQSTGEWERMEGKKRFTNYGVQTGWKRITDENGFIPLKDTDVIFCDRIG